MVVPNLKAVSCASLGDQASSFGACGFRCRCTASPNSIFKNHQKDQQKTRKKNQTTAEPCKNPVLPDLERRSHRRNRSQSFASTCRFHVGADLLLDADVAAEGMQVALAAFLEAQILQEPLDGFDSHSLNSQNIPHIPHILGRTGDGDLEHSLDFLTSKVVQLNLELHPLADACFERPYSTWAWRHLATSVELVEVLRTLKKWVLLLVPWQKLQQWQQ